MDRLFDGAGVDIGAAVEKPRRGVEEATFRGDMDESCAPDSERAAARGTAIEVREEAVKKRRVAIEKGGEFGGVTAEDQETC
jgi:hypothetical protein